MNTTDKHHSTLHTIQSVRDGLKTCAILYVSSPATSLHYKDLRLQNDLYANFYLSE